MTQFIKITPKDLQSTFELASEIWHDNYIGIITQEQVDYMLHMMYRPKKIKEDINNNYQWELVYQENAPIGYLSYVIKNDNRVFLSKIYLKNKSQGLGIGKKMLHRVIEYAKLNKCKAVYLTVNKNNIKGIRAYKGTGFKIISEEVTDIGDGYVMDDYIFEKNI
jgi:ribosomal protein S18 acetylase RimI-like enzyme